MAGCPDAKAAPFFPEIDPVFGVTNPAAHYHVPVVVSPFGYSTYRGLRHESVTSVRQA